ncbi:MAG: imidazole glycerol phosphate synthase subunit HisH [Flavobacteriales bacterium]|nr:imidazole glycerol phosphate synthase subunit HisH [Flavobacteriales bacterium]MCX7768081.1 imidazole glycerol phosphate synthase subunit HisH [Flavobacteriales bacterium]MDW8410353.1 imidazole glycerol phosphate synthase subunit HisH [Flavobacteriales bacterium]
MVDIGVLSYGVGNVQSILHMLDALRVPSIRVEKPEQVAQCRRLILPGVGAFDEGMQKLRAGGWEDILKLAVLEEGKPLLGLCLGMQMLLENSEEGTQSGLGFIRGRVKALKGRAPQGLPLPHMGWNYVFKEKESPLIANLDENARFYFAHSFYAEPEESVTILSVEYGFRFTCGVQKDCIFGVQFHPERSHRFGMHLLKNFSVL